MYGGRAEASVQAASPGSEEEQEAAAKRSRAAGSVKIKGWRNAVSRRRGAAGRAVPCTKRAIMVRHGLEVGQRWRRRSGAGPGKACSSVRGAVQRGAAGDPGTRGRRRTEAEVADAQRIREA